LSALNQTYQDIEIILVDDCGEDNSMSVARQIADNHPNGHKVHFLKHECNKGPATARNTGIDAANGEYIYFLDSDDEITLDCIERLTSGLENRKLDFVIGNYKVVGSEMEYPPLKLTRGILTSNSKILHAYLVGDWYSMPVNKLINKNFLLNNNLYFHEGIYHTEDELWSFQMSMKAETMGVSPDVTYTYHIQGNSITQNIKRKNIDDMLFVVEQLMHIINSDEKLLKNPEALIFYEKFRFQILINASKTELWKYAHEKLKKMAIFNRNLIMKAPVKLIIRMIMTLFLPQPLLFFILKKKFQK
jgi:glycosyltransferase involved in cell wall biosynthesis